MRNSVGRQFAALTILLAAFTLFASPPARAQSLSLPAGGQYQLHFRTSVAGVNAQGYLDSLGVSINGAVQTLDTLAVINTAELSWSYPGFAQAGTAFGIARISFVGANTSTDSLFVQTQCSPDGNNWATSGFVAIAAASNADNCITGRPVQVDLDALGPGTSDMTLCRYIRFILRADGNTASKFLCSAAYMDFWKRPGL